MTRNNQEIICSILSAVGNAQQEKISYSRLHNVKPIPGYENEFLFFIKPEITLAMPDIKLTAILEMVFRQFEKFSLTVNDIRIIGAGYLKQYDIIARHYGVINAASRSAVNYLSDDARSRFKSYAGKSIENVTLLGSLEMLKRYPGFTPATLDYLWKNSGTEKLAAGTYVAKTRINNQEVYFVNGFHPWQLEHYTQKGRSVVIMVLSGNISWKEARSEFIGATNPMDAFPGSLRNQLLQRRDEFGLAAVSSGRNGFHLSAGPVEGLVELIRYTSDYSDNNISKASDFHFGKLLESRFNSAGIEGILNNKQLDVNGKKISVFDLTEEKNSTEALEILSSCIPGD